MNEPEINAPEQSLTFRRRHPLIAFFFSLLIPGLGQFYNGQPAKAFILYAGTLFIPLVFGISRLLTVFDGLVALLIVTLLFRIYVLVDAIIVARGLKTYRVKKYNAWYWYIGLCIVHISFSFLFDFSALTGMKTYSIPSMGNSPVLEVGDFVMCDLRAFEEGEPQYGDLLAFEQGNEVYVFPVVGLSGDTIVIKNNVLFVNGKECRQNFVSKEVRNDILYMQPVVVKTYIETLPGGFKHYISLFDPVPDSLALNYGPVVVERGTCFVMGNARNNALDSRYIGTVNPGRYVGRLCYIYWGNNLSGRKRNLRKSL
jgi:signal peptidase I